MNYVQKKALDLRVKAANLLLPRVPSGSSLSTFMSMGKGVASWTNYKQNADYLKAYNYNIGVGAVIDIKNKAKSNVRIKFVDNDTNMIIQKKDYTPEMKKLNSLLDKPNPFQNRSEFFEQFGIYRDVFGNAFIYPNASLGYRPTINNVESLAVIPSQHMDAIVNSKVVSPFSATKKTDIIAHYLFRYGSFEKEFNVDEIIHRNDVSIDFDPGNLTMGVSKLRNLEKPINNIDIAMESRNVLGKKRGALGVFSSDKKDATGSFPLTSTEKESVQKEFENYGTLEKQWQYIITSQPLKYQKTVMNIDELKLFEEVATDIIHISNKYNVPEILTKAYIQGATFENQEVAWRRLYQDAVIPETESDFEAINNFFETEKLGWKVIGDFSHVPVLQEDEQQAATTQKTNSDKYEKMFLKGAATYGEWRKAAGANDPHPLDPKYIWDLNEKQLAVIGNKISDNGNTGL